MPRRTTRRRSPSVAAAAGAGRTLGAGLGMVTAVAGPPAGLVFLDRFYWTDSGGLPGLLSGPPTAAGWLILATLAGWAVWAVIAGALLCDLVTCLRARPWRGPRWRLPVALHTAVTSLAGGTALLASSVLHGGPPGTTGPTPTPAGTTTTDRAAPTTASAPGAPGVRLVAATSPARQTHPVLVVAAGAPAGPAAGRTVTVHRGDTLWRIAARYLGDPHRWPDIYHLNTDRYDRHGRMRGGDHIESSWVLTLPDDATPPAGAQPTDPPATTGPGQQPEPGGPPQTQQPPPSTSAAAPPSAGATPSAAAPSTPAQTSAPGSATPEAQPVPAATPTGSSATTSASPAPSATPHAHGSDPATPRTRPHGVELNGGSWVDIGLALAIVAAATLVWAHRRRRYTPQPPSATLRLDPAPMPPVVTQVRRGLHRRPAPPADNGEQNLDTDVPDLHPDIDDSGQTTADAGHHHTDPADDTDEEEEDEGDEEDEDDEDDEEEPAAADGPAPVPVVPSLANPLSALWPPAGLGLTGPGAEAAARGFLAAGLAAGGLDDPDARTWVVMPSGTAATLLGSAAVALPRTPRLTLTAGLDEALDLLEAQTMHRTRLVYRHEVDDVAALRQADPLEEPLPPVMLLADAATRHGRARIAALLSQGQRLDIHGVLLGAWPDGDTIVVAADGTTTPADGGAVRHGRHPADVGRLAVLDPTETADLLGTLAEAHTGQPQAPAPTQAVPPDTAPAEAVPPRSAPGQPAAEAAAVPEPDPAVTAGDATTPDVSDVPATAVDHQQDADPAPATPASPPDPGPPDAPVTGAEVTAPTAERAPADDSDEADDDTGGTPAPDRPGRVEVTVLGAPRILGADPQRSPRAKSLELLVYLAVHGGDAAAETILEDLLPDAHHKRAPHRLHTYVSDLRGVMKLTGGPGTYIPHPDRRYVLNRDIIDIDLWRMRAAIGEAENSTDPAIRVAALRRAVDTYRGPLAQGYDYEWIEAYREAVRQQALDAAVALTDALDGRPADQVTVLDAAIHLHPYAEGLYQAAMRARAALGHLDAVRTLRRAVTRRMAEIDAEPGEDTLALADRLVAQLQQPGRRATPRPAARHDDGAAA